MKITLFILLAFTLNVGFSQIQFSTDSFESTFKPSMEMDYKLIDKISVKIPIDEDFMKYDKIMTFIRVFKMENGKWIRGSRPEVQALYPKDPIFKDRYGDLDAIEYSLYGKGRDDLHLVDSRSWFKGSASYDKDVLYKADIYVEGYFHDSYTTKYNNQGNIESVKTYKFSKVLRHSEEFAFTKDDEYYAAGAKYLEFTNKYDYYFVTPATEVYKHLLYDLDDKTAAIKLLEKLIALPKKEYKAMMKELSNAFTYEQKETIILGS